MSTALMFFFFHFHFMYIKLVLLLVSKLKLPRTLLSSLLVNGHFLFTCLMQCLHILCVGNCNYFPLIQL